MVTMERNLVIFDCDGVLVDSEPIANQVTADLLGAHGLVLSAAEAESHSKGLSDPAIVAKIRTDWGVTLPPDFISRLETAVWAHLEVNLQPVAGVAQAVAAVVRSGSALCVASSSPRESTTRKLAITGLLPHFEDRLHSADQVPRGKPFPDVFLYAASMTGFAPEECVVVEDSVPGVQAGLAAGMRVLAYASMGGAEALQTAGGSAFTHMDELPALLGNQVASQPPRSRDASRGGAPAIASPSLPARWVFWSWPFC